MRIELKKAIMKYVLDNINYFNLTNQTTEHFSEYIYDKTGNYLIGGEAVYQFIKDTINLIKREI